MLDKHGGETLHRTERSAVNHHRSLLSVVLGGVLQLEAYRQVIVHLDGTQLPAAADSVLHHEVELRTVESGLAILHLSVQALLLTSVDDSLLCLCPHLVRTDVLLVVVRVAERDLRLEVVEVEC